MSITELKAQRCKIKTAITRHETAVNEIKEEDDYLNLEVRLSNLEHLFCDFNKIQTEIENLEIRGKEENEIESIIEENQPHYIRVESQYFATVAKIKRILLNNKEQNQAQLEHQVPINNTETSNSFMLKPLPLPKFDGKHTQWFTFFDSFKSLVHDNKSLSDIRKFHYLRGCLSEDALSAIASLAVSNDNYEIAVELLKKRFENKRLIVQDHIANILNIPMITKPSVVELRKLIDTVNSNMAALKVLELPVENWDALLISILTEKLDYAIKREWQGSLQKEVPTYSVFNEFLERRYQIMQAVNPLKSNGPSNSKQSFPQTNARGTNNFKPLNGYQRFSNKFASHVVTNRTVCVNCDGAHSISQCIKFLNLRIDDRINRVEELGLCLNCLRSNHAVESCRITKSCHECQERHHTLLHKIETNQLSTLFVQNCGQIILGTAIVLIQDNQGTFRKCRALLDQGSEANIITLDFCKRWNIPIKTANSRIYGVCATDNPVSHKARVMLKSRLTEFTTDLNCLVMKTITRPTPAISFDSNLIQIPAKISNELADPNFNQSSPIDLLIGAELFWNLLIGAAIQISSQEPHFQRTHLGYIVGGKLSRTGAITNEVSVLHITNIKPTLMDLENQVKEFWNQEQIDVEIFNSEDVKCEQHFRKNTLRHSSGKFVVKLPFKDEGSLGDSRQLALRQFVSLEKRFTSNNHLEKEYKEFMREYLELNHMEQVPFNELQSTKAYYLPHHAVFKTTIEGPKIRVVFNASARSTNGLSLNDILMTGPQLQQDLFSLLCRFRTHKVVLSADVTKMYRMILVNPDNRDFQRILWRHNSQKPIQTYRLKTLTYGTTCAPFLAVRVLHQLATELNDQYPLATEIIKRDFYMDDLLTGANSVEEARSIQNQIKNILASGGFNLCKWASNASQLMPQNMKASNSINFNKDDIKVLGFLWNYKVDCLRYKVYTENMNNLVISKRIILSTIARIFDPLGLINPVIVKAKLLLQTVFVAKLSWDSPVPVDIKNEFLRFYEELSELRNIRIPRKLIGPGAIVTRELHSFSDASSKAYGVAIYLRTINNIGAVYVNLVCAKSRVAPIKQITLPRLELNAAVLSSKITAKVANILNLKIDRRFYWTDSTIVLAWVNADPSNWRQYVANRVTEIQKNSNANEWHHVRSESNPADVVSRGATPNRLHHLSLWWQGPQWLSKNQEEWPLAKKESQEVELETEKEKMSTAVVNVIKVSPILPAMLKYSSFKKTQRIIAYCLRFVNNCKTKTKMIQPLSLNELNHAVIVILKRVQDSCFAEEIHNLIKGGTANKFQKLDPFIDENGLFRVGGRLKHAYLIHYDNRHPIILPDKHHVTALIIKQFHEREMHAGVLSTLAALRQQYWPINGRNEVKKIVGHCFKCARANPINISQKMGNLPKQRLQPSRPFNISGIDYAGPILIKQSKIRNARKLKAYIALFICFATKAVHLELVSDLSAQGFLAALKRFTSRRGNVAEIFSDNGTNFVGAERELFRSQQFQEETKGALKGDNILFHFIPARSPHFGGLWERSVRSVKHHLIRVVGNASLTYEEFYTVLTSVEACVNSRPLTPISSDPNDLEALTPGHFLIGAPLTAVVDTAIIYEQRQRLSRWQQVQQMQQHFWNRWHREYISQLQIRPRGQQVAKPNISVGALVVIKEEGVTPLKWKLGRVRAVHPGSDGLVRVITIKTATGELKRAVNKVGLLPIEN